MRRARNDYIHVLVYYLTGVYPHPASEEQAGLLCHIGVQLPDTDHPTHLRGGTSFGRAARHGERLCSTRASFTYTAVAAAATYGAAAHPTM